MDPERAPRSTAERLLALPLDKREALKALLQHRQPATPSARAGSPTRDVPMSYGQQRLWFLDQLAPGSAAYNIPAAVPLEAPVHLPSLRQALTEIVRRHSALRTVFRMGAAGPVQDICAPADVDLRVIPIAGDTASDPRRELTRLATLELQRPFDLANGPLFRAILFMPDAGDPLLLMSLHHIVADGWSLGILFHELSVLRAAYQAGLPSPLKPLPLQYADFAIWQHMTLTDDRLAAPLAYWRARLEHAPALQLPTDRPAAAARTFEGAQYAILAPAATRDRLHQLNLSEGVTMNMTLLAAFELLLHHYSGQEDFVIGLPVAGRHSPETERLIGFFVNFLLVRTDLGGAPSFRELLHRVRRTVLEGFEHQDVPFERLVSALHPDREPGRNPLFQVTFQLFAGAQSASEISRPAAGSIDIDKGTALFDLVFNLWETTRGVEGRIEYSTDLFDRDTIARMAEHFVVLLEAIADDPDRGLADLPVMTAAERERVLTEFNATGASSVDGRCIHELVESRAAQHPGRPAVRAGHAELTYGQLNASANQVAHMLIAAGAGAETVVAVCLDRSPRLIAALLGILKTGAAYLPIDPRYPPERIAYLVRDARAAVLLTDAATPPLPAVDGRVMSMDDAVDRPASDPHVAVRPEQLAYLIYTSGSTGAPKGVEVEHRALRNLVDWHLAAYDVGPGDRTTQIASVSFDAAVWEIWPTLAAGASIAIADDDIRTDPPRLLQWLADEAITICFLPTPLAEAVLRVLRESGSGMRDPGSGGRPPLVLRELLTGGDRLRYRPDSALPFRLTNHYGPTENTVVATAGTVGPGASTSLPGIGRPIRNNRTYILDRRRQPVPIGVPGEIHIAGASLARGYHDRPELTDERFVCDPFSAVPGDRMYRTGDLARWRPDGTIEFLGRGDRQLKIRGVRVEAGEIEAALARHPRIRDAAVAGRPDARGDLQLVAYVVADADPPFAADPAMALRDFLAAQLPDSMIPAAFVPLDALPLTPNGKIDVDALPLPDRRPVPVEDPGPASDIERTLIGIWQQVLRAGAVGVHDDFFTDHGGHSLLTVALVSRIREAFQVELPLRAVFEAPTVRRLAARIQSAPARAAGAARVIPRRRDPDRAPCSFAQQRLWFLDRLTPGHGFYNIPAALRMDPPLDPAMLQRSLDALVARHEALRTTLHHADGEPVQRIASAGGVRIAVTDLRSLPDDRREDEALRLATLEARAPFTLDGGALLRVGLLQLGTGHGATRNNTEGAADTTRAAASGDVLLVTLHHIIADGWSVEVFFRELAMIYDACTRGEEPRLEPLPIQYGDYAEWQRGSLRESTLGAELDYWRSRLAGAPALELPSDRPRPALSTYQGGREFVHVDRRVTAGLEGLSHANRVTLFMTLLAAFQTLLFRYSGQHDLVLGTVTAGRDRVETEGLIGLFVNTLALRTDMSGNPPFRELLARVKEVALAAYGHADVPFEKLVEELQPQRDLGRNPIVQVTFQLFSAPAAGGRLLPAGVEAGVEPASGDPQPASRQLDVDRGVATFDLSLDMWPIDGALKGRLEYSTDLFDAGSTARMARHFETLLDSIVREPGTPIERLALVDAAGAHQQLVEWNRTARAYPAAESVHALFGAQVHCRPDAIAVMQGASQITYAALDRRADEIAARLRQAGVCAETVVAICLGRSVEWVAAVLGVLKSGAAYLPLDPSYPPHRIEQLLDDSGARFAITAGPAPASFDRVTVVDLESRQPLLEHVGEREKESPFSLSPLCTKRSDLPTGSESGNHRRPHSALAYVLYTSGSTGTPKGVMVEHAALVNHAFAIRDRDGLTGEDRVLQFAPLGFDVAAEEVFPTLAAGATVVLRPDVSLMTPGQLAAYMTETAVTVANLPSAYWHEWADVLDAVPVPASLRLLIVGSERVDARRAARWLDRTNGHPRLVNAYGATETTITSLCADLSAEPWGEGDAVPVGRPLPNMTAYILDRHMQPLPIGVTGDLYVGGAGLARGYVRADSSAFLPSPLGTGRLYRTGDRARYLPDGRIVLCGRADAQVKIRGFRVEPAEIEAAIKGHSGVRDAVAIARDGQLVAYVVAEGTMPADLSSYLETRLPRYMLPAFIVPMEHVPLTPHGKLDAAALPSPQPAAAGARVVPDTGLERVVARIWEEALSIERAGADDNFFELGGHSLLLLRVHSRLEATLQRDIAIVDLFRYPTIRSIARFLGNGHPPAAAGLSRAAAVVETLLES